VKVSYALSCNIDKAESALKIYEEERRKLLEKYCEKNKDGSIAVGSDGRSAKFKDEKARESFKKDIESLLDIEADVNIRKIKLADLAGTNFSAAEISTISDMVDEK
jgi:hypothetical protein